MNTKQRIGGWTDAHIAILREHYPTQGAAWVAERTGHSVNGTIQHAVKLGVRNVVSTRNGIEYRFKAARSKTPVDMSSVVITRVPTPVGRYAVADDYIGVFSRVGIGRDVESGKGWK